MSKGNLGSSVARSLHNNPRFHVRVLSRDPNGPKARKLAGQGIEVVKADCWKAEELETAFQGCWGIFINIDSDAPVRTRSLARGDSLANLGQNFKQRIGLGELEMAKIVIDTAVKSGILHAVHASLPAASKLTNGQVPVLAFDGETTSMDKVR